MKRLSLIVLTVLSIAALSGQPAEASGPSGPERPAPAARATLGQRAGRLLRAVFTGRWFSRATLPGTTVQAKPATVTKPAEVNATQRATTTTPSQPATQADADAERARATREALDRFHVQSEAAGHNHFGGHHTGLRSPEYWIDGRWGHSTGGL